MVCCCADTDNVARQPSTQQRSPAGEAQQLPSSLGPNAADAADDADRSPLFARAAVPSPVKAEQGSTPCQPPQAGDDGREANGAAASGQLASTSGKRTAAAGGLDVGSPAESELSADLQPKAAAGTAGAGSRAGVAANAERPAAAGEPADRQHDEPAPRKGQAKAGAKRKQRDESRDGASAGLVPKAARVAALPLNGKRPPNGKVSDFRHLLQPLFSTHTDWHQVRGRGVCPTALYV